MTDPIPSEATPSGVPAPEASAPRRARASRTAPDRATFERWVRAHHAAVYRTARALVADPALAEDVAQEVFLRVLEGAVDAEAREPERLLRWLAARTALARLRSATRRRAREERHAMERPEAVPAPSPEESETRNTLARLVERLPAELRTPLVLRFHEGLTFRQVADLEGCSEPTAHARVGRALERLRADLARAGVAGFVGGLPAHLARLPVAPVPRALEPKLLALGAHAAVASGAGLTGLALPATLVAVLALAAWLGLADPRASDEPRASESAAELALDSESAGAPPSLAAEPADSRAPAGGDSAASERAAAGPPAPEHALFLGAGEPALELAAVAHPTGVVLGRVVDGHGAPVGHARVDARSAEQSSKSPRFAVAGTADALGRYRLEVPVAEADGQAYRVHAALEGWRPAESPLVLVRAGATTGCPDLVLDDRASDPRGDFELVLTVRAPDGAPVAGARAVLLRALPGAPPLVEARGPSDAQGGVTLAGAHLGAKLLTVLVPDAGFAPWRAEVTIDAPGTHEREVVLAPGLAITGVVRSVEPEATTRPSGGGFFLGTSLALLDATPLAPHGLGERWSAVQPLSTNATADRDGRFALRGLAPGDYVVLVRRGGDSPARLERVAAGTRDLVVTLKRADDPRDHGDHRAELHGTLRDAATGEPLPTRAAAVRARPAPTADRATLLAEHAFELVRPFQGQTMDELEPDAAFHLTGLDAGSWVVVVNRGGHAPAIAGPFVLAEREIRADLEIALERPVTLSGLVVDDRDRPVEGALVFLTAAGAGASADVAARDAHVRAATERGLFDVGHHARTDATGRFELPGVAPSIPARVAAVHPAHGSASPLPFDPASPTPLRLRLGPPR